MDRVHYAISGTVMVIALLLISLIVLGATPPIDADHFQTDLNKTPGWCTAHGGETESLMTDLGESTYCTFDNGTSILIQQKSDQSAPLLGPLAIVFVITILIGVIRRVQATSSDE